MLRILRSTVLHPRFVVPGVLEVPDDGGRTWRFLHQKAQRICLLGAMTVVMRHDEKLIKRAFADARNEAFPDSRISPRSQRMRFPVPSIEASEHINLLCTGRPDAEARAFNPTSVGQTGTHLFVDS